MVGAPSTLSAAEWNQQEGFLEFTNCLYKPPSLFRKAHPFRIRINLSHTISVTDTHPHVSGAHRTLDDLLDTWVIPQHERQQIPGSHSYTLSDIGFYNTIISTLVRFFIEQAFHDTDILHDEIRGSSYVATQMRSLRPQLAPYLYQRSNDGFYQFILRNFASNPNFLITLGEFFKNKHADIYKICFSGPHASFMTTTLFQNMLGHKLKALKVPHQSPGKAH